MDQSERLASNQTKIEFLSKIIDLNEGHFESFFNRASILLAANAILLTGVIGFGIPLATSASTGRWTWIKMTLVVASLLSSVLSTLLIGALIAPMVATQRARKQMLDIGPSEFNVFFFMKITEYTKNDYLEAITSLTEGQIIEQLASDAHNSSRILTMRLERLKRAYLAFIVSIVMFVILGIVSLLI